MGQGSQGPTLGGQTRCIFTSEMRYRRSLRRIEKLRSFRASIADSGHEFSLLAIQLIESL